MVPFGRPATPDLQEEPAVARRCEPAAQDARVAVDLDRETQPPELPPDRQQPREGDRGQARDEEQERVPAADVLGLVRQNERAFGRFQAGSKISSFMLVQSWCSIAQGVIVFTRIPTAARSRATGSVSPTTPPFEAE